MSEGVVALLIPITAILMVLGIVVAGFWGQAQARRLRAEQRMAMVARGMAIGDIERLLGHGADAPAKRKDPFRSLAATRRTAIGGISAGLGLGAFGAVLAYLVRTREVLVVAAAGLIPLAVGIGFLIDYAIQKRELARFGQELGAELP